MSFENLQLLSGHAALNKYAGKSTSSDCVPFRVHYDHTSITVWHNIGKAIQEIFIGLIERPGSEDWHLLDAHGCLPECPITYPIIYHTPAVMYNYIHLAAKTVWPFYLRYDLLITILMVAFLITKVKIYQCCSTLVPGYVRVVMEGGAMLYIDWCMFI